jgi:ankyrin repeat protein
MLCHRFRWVVCQLKTLLPCFPASIRDALEDLPETLDITYERILLRIERRSREYAHRLLQCLTVAVRPLRVQQLSEVLAIRFDPGNTPEYHEDWRLEDAHEAVLSACSSLVAIIDVDGSPIVQFSHFSVKEFLTSDRLARAKANLSCYHILPQPAHTILAQACLCSLLRLDDNVDKDKMEGFPLSIYAAQHWVDHGQFENVSSRIQELMERLFDHDKPQFAIWIWIYNIDQPWDWVKHMSSMRPTRPAAVPLYYAILCGFRSIVERLIVSRPTDVNTRGGTYATPLHAALRKGCFDIALLLLEHGADVNGLDNKTYSPLHDASASGRRDIVEFLLGPYPDVYDPNTKSVYAASRDGELKVKWVSLRYGVDVDSRSIDGRTPLKTATRHGHLDIVQLLLQSGATVESRCRKNTTPIWEASSWGNLAMVQLLLSNNAYVDSRVGNGVTPLMAASRRGHLDVVQLLLRNGAAVDARDNEGRTPLMSATEWGHLDIVQTLLDEGAPIDSNTQKRETALYMASRRGLLKVARLLIERGANVTFNNDDGSTPCHIASQNGHLGVVSLLVDKGTDVDVRNVNHSTPLAVATANGKLDVSRFLIECRAGVDSTDRNGSTSLHHASQKGHLDVVRLLLDHRANIHAQRADLWTPLHLATSEGHSEVVELLIQRGADVRKPDKEQNTDSNDASGWTPFDIATRNGHLDIIKILLKSSTNVPSTEGIALLVDLAQRNRKRNVARVLAEHIGMGNVDSWTGVDVSSPVTAPQNTHLGVVEPESSAGHGESANALDNVSLYTASKRGRLEVVRSLLGRGADVNERHRSYGTPLDVASREGRLGVAKLLIEHRADVNSRDEAGWTPLHKASRKGHLDIVRLLLDQGADVNATEQNLLTPLDLASFNGQLEVVKLLLERGANAHV